MRPTFSVPTWCWQEHAAGSEDVILFECNDSPVLEALALYRDEAYGDEESLHPRALRKPSIAVAAPSTRPAVITAASTY